MNDIKNAIFKNEDLDLLRIKFEMMLFSLKHDTPPTIMINVKNFQEVFSRDVIAKIKAEMEKNIDAIS